MKEASFFPHISDGMFRFRNTLEQTRSMATRYREKEDLTEMKLAESSGLVRFIVAADAIVDAIKAGLFSVEWLALWSLSPSLCL